MKLIGAIPFDNKLPTFALPVYADDCANLHTQEINQNKNKIVAFNALHTTEEIFKLEHNKECNLGSTPLFVLILSENSNFIGDTDSFNAKLQDFRALNLPSSILLQIEAISNQGSSNTQSRLDYISRLKIYDNFELEKSFIESTITFSGWEKILELRADAEVKKNLRKELKYIKFFIDQDNKVSATTLGQVNNTNIEELNDIAEKLSIQFNDLIIQTKQSSKSSIQETPEQLEIKQVNISRIQMAMDRMGRQEERIAFLLIAMSYFPEEVTNLHTYDDRAKTGKMGIKVIKDVLSAAIKSGERTSNIQRCISMIIWRWETGDRWLFIVYLLKWSYSNPNLFSQVLDFVGPYSNYSIIKIAKKESNYHSPNVRIPSVPNLISTPEIQNMYSMIRIAELDFDRLIYGWLKP